MNGVPPNHTQNASTRLAKPPPAGPTPPAPATTAPIPPNQSNAAYPSHTTHRSSLPQNHTQGINGHHAQKGKKRNDVPVDPATMYESLKNRIAALEEEEVLEEEEERRYGIHRLITLCPRN